MSHVTIQSRNGSLLLDRIRENISKGHFFFPLVRSGGTHLSIFFTFSICFKCQTTTEWLMLSSLAKSCVVLRGSASWASHFVVVDFQWLATVLLIFKALVSCATLLESPLHYMFINNSWAKWIVDVASYLCYFMTHFWTQIKKSLKFAFCLTPFP